MEDERSLEAEGWCEEDELCFSVKDTMLAKLFLI